MKLTGWFRRKSKTPSNSLSRSPGSGVLSFSSGSSKSPVETPKSVLDSRPTADESALKASPLKVSVSVDSEICLKEAPNNLTRTTSYTVVTAPAAASSSAAASAAASSSLVGVNELHEVFKVFDSNGDGKITKVELGCVLRKLGDDLSEEELHLMVKAADKDGDGCISLEEFITLNTCGAGTGDVEGIPAMDELKDAFHIFDADKNGLISAEELHRVLTSLGDESCTVDDCRRMIDGVDEDGDGCVNFDEFRRMMTC